MARGRHLWHAHECEAFRSLPDGCKKGDTSIIRMLLRYRLSSEIGEWSAEKEPVADLSMLQRNKCEIPPSQLKALAAATGVTREQVAALILAIRTNASEVFRGGRKVGCALSALMAAHNHACAPNAAARIGENGRLQIRALKALAMGDEALISYVDTALPIAQRARILSEHYGFDCKCTRCGEEKRAALRARLKKR